ncbi:MAG: hypothetical protein J6V66_00930 [Clostridia bacterium]|nr:hypothetical protein [Clostridia bacterium]
MDELVRKNRIQCICALVACSVVVVCVCIGVTMNLTTLHDENFDNMGIRTFCMFTVNSNILSAVAAFIVIPYAIDGLRKKEYVLPNWVVVFMLACTTAVALTFLISLFVLAPFKGFVLIFTGSRFFLHGVCPILSILAFCVFITSHKITVKQTFFSLIPVTIYAIVYFVMVVVVTSERGGWEDFYGFATKIPIWISATVLLPLTFGIATLIRFWHNKSFVNRRKNEAQIFLDYFDNKNASEIIFEIGKARATIQCYGEVVVPTLVVRKIMYFTDSDLQIEEACKLYLDGYFSAVKVKK